jgi:hypothetical protein
MKKLILSMMLAAFAVAVQAGEEKSCSDKEGSGCCGKAKASEKVKVSTQVQAKGEEAKGGCCQSKQQVSTTTCPFTGKTTAKAGKANGRQALKSPKAGADARS